MRGVTRSLSPRRRLIADLMHASQSVPLITLRQTLDVGRLIESRRVAAQPPGFAAMFAKAFGLVARDAPALRTLHLTWPWSRLCVLPHAVGIVAIAREDAHDPYVQFEKLNDPAALGLRAIDTAIRAAKASPSDEASYFRRLIRVSSLPLLLRRLIWGVVLNSGRLRGNQAGTFGITAVSSLADNELHALSPGPYILSYGRVTDRGTIDVTIRWDHRVADGALIARALKRLEAVLNDEIAAEIGSSAA